MPVLSALLWLDLNKNIHEYSTMMGIKRRSLLRLSTALPTAPQPQPNCSQHNFNFPKILELEKQKYLIEFFIHRMQELKLGGWFQNSNLKLFEFKWWKTLKLCGDLKTNIYFSSKKTPRSLIAAGLMVALAWLQFTIKIKVINKCSSKFQ